VPRFVREQVGAQPGVWYEVDRAYSVRDVIGRGCTHIANPGAADNAAARNATSEHVNHVAEEPWERRALHFTPECGVLHKEIVAAAEISADVWIAARGVADDDA
jgi:hypothetical protein